MPGLPVVAVGVMGTRTVMRGDNGGFMVDEDLDDFADAAVRLLSDPGLRAAKSAEAAAWSGQFSIAAQTDRMLRIYEFVSAARRSTRSATSRIRIRLRWLFRAVQGLIARFDE